jgi:hypothetical protein
MNPLLKETKEARKSKARGTLPEKDRLVMRRVQLSRVKINKRSPLYIITLIWSSAEKKA